MEHMKCFSWLQALGNVLHSGSHEYSEFSANFSAWKNDQRAVQEPAFGALLTQASFWIVLPQYLYGRKGLLFFPVELFVQATIVQAA